MMLLHTSITRSGIMSVLSSLTVLVAFLLMQVPHSTITPDGSGNAKTSCIACDVSQRWQDEGRMFLSENEEVSVRCKEHTDTSGTYWEDLGALVLQRGSGNHEEHRVTFLNSYDILNDIYTAIYFVVVPLSQPPLWLLSSPIRSRLWSLKVVGGP